MVVFRDEDDSTKVNAEVCFLTSSIKRGYGRVFEGERDFCYKIASELFKCRAFSNISIDLKIENVEITLNS